MKFIRMILKDGAGPQGLVLKSETVQRMSKNGLGALKCSPWTSCIPSMTNDGDFYPGLSKSWAYSFQVNDEPTPSGRPAGSLMWAGLGNLFYWIDRSNGIGGYFAAQIMPFMDVAAYPGFVDFETAVYQWMKR
jgi:methyl acetate hydrolase